MKIDLKQTLSAVLAIAFFSIAVGIVSSITFGLSAEWGIFIIIFAVLVYTFATAKSIVSFRGRDR